MLFNLSGYPAVVIPIGQTSHGLPIGMQIVGKRWKEMELLARCFADTARVAQQLDTVISGFRSPPGY